MTTFYRPGRYPPLTAEEARAIFERNPTSDMHRVLWEVARLQHRMLDAAHIMMLSRRCGPAEHEAAEIRSDAFMRAAAIEPAFVEREARRDIAILEVEGGRPKRKP